MNIIELKESTEISENGELGKIYAQFQGLLKELRKKELPEKIVEFVNHDIDDINSTSLTGKELGKFIKQKQTKIIKLLENELKIVPKEYYQNLWLALGICVFGLPIGVVFGSILDNMGLLAIGLPIGLAIGSVMGSRMDKKAFEEGRQLDMKLNIR